MGLKNIGTKQGTEAINVLAKEILPKLLVVFQSIHAYNELILRELVMARLRKDFPEKSLTQIKGYLDTEIELLEQNVK